MKIYASKPLETLNADDRKIVWDLMNEVLAVQTDIARAEPFYFEYCNICMMFDPTSDFLFEIPDMPLPSLGGHVDGHLILAAYSAANDRLPHPLEDSLL